MQGLLNALEASSCWTIIWTSVACAVKEYPVTSVWIALAVVAFVAVSIVKYFNLQGPDTPDLSLMSVDAVDGLRNDGRNLVIVALVGTDLRIRIFDANGKKVVDKAENQLISGATLTALKKQLNPLPDESRLSREEKRQFILDATLIAGHTPPGKVPLERSLHSFYEAVQYGSILVLTVLCLHAIALDCCRVSDRDGALAFWGSVISGILIVAVLVTHNQTLRGKLYRVLAEQISLKPIDEPDKRDPEVQALDYLSRCGKKVLFIFLLVSLGTVGTLIGITGGLTSSVFAFLLAGFVSVSATVSERTLVPVMTSVFCITVAFVTVLAPKAPPPPTFEVMALGKPCQAWMYFLMFSATLALAAGADVRRNRPLKFS